MFCGNCGKEINDGVTFCPECGAKTGITSSNNIEESKVYSRPKKINPKVKIAAIVLIIIAVLSVIGIKMINYIQSIPNDNEITLTANNIMNSAIASTDGEWLFYFEDDFLFREKLSNGKNKECINSTLSHGLVYYLGNKLYIGTLSKHLSMNIKGEDITDIPNSTWSQYKFQTDGKRIYIKSNDTDGISVQGVNGDKLKKISDIYADKILFNGEKLYVFSLADSINNQHNNYKGVTIIDTDGKNEKHILDFCPENFAFGGDKIFYTDKNDVLHSMNFDGSNQQQFNDILVGDGLNVYDDFVYFVDRESGNICKISESGESFIKILNACRSWHINITDDWIIYQNKDDSFNLYKMKLDGTENQPLYD
ncbi:MAG: DUF5050 domain-containing protein [Clostridia bacterium]|nr:DUF5050 domain-containing protein [Clostridia bacterium]